MAQGISIHIGLNRVDPGHYQGWAGELGGCEFDANDMLSIAESIGFEACTSLLTTDATVENVTAALSQAASQLSSGDILFLTYSGHGGSLPDKNGDEPDQRDETWVLYDRQFVDDELFSLYVKFKAGVRILVLSDSCHSGTCAKQLPSFLNPGALEARFGTSAPAGIERRVRTIPLDVRRRVEEANEALYDEVQRSTPANDNVDLDASLLLISGCQDNQTSADGDRNGLFTGTLLDVWNGGKFKLYYRGFHRAIVERMPPDQTPNLFFIGERNPKFRRQKPFTI
jgi:hypothetical protein